ncbi:MAG: aminotransferase class III-fold pyridoxal phosphate-dependent enzyme [Burkholderiaceae bacterium]
MTTLQAAQAGRQGGVPILDAYWMPFTPNRRFKRAPQLLVGADGMYYRHRDGRRILDGIAGLWCVNAGHRHPRIVEAMTRQLGELDFASSFQVSHPAAFELADRLCDWAGNGLAHAFFTNSGSESVDTALKIALAYHRARGHGGRFRLIGRERSYHGMGFGGLSVGGIGKHRSAFGPLLPGTDHLPHTHDPARNAFSRGLPPHGADKADALEAILALHDPATVAAVIVEPVAGSTGVLPPPQGYLQALRGICDRHGILLIFDEVITGFGRLGAPLAATRFGVRPDIVTLAKGLTNAAVPMGAVLVSADVYQAFMQGPEEGVELAHGYTYSGHPLACAAALATLDVHRDEALAQRAAELSPAFEALAHGLRSAPGVIDIRNIGLLAGIELQARPGAPGAAGQAVAAACLAQDVLVRPVGDTIALSPPLIARREEVERLVETVDTALRSLENP